MNYDVYGCRIHENINITEPVDHSTKRNPSNSFILYFVGKEHIW